MVYKIVILGDFNPIYSTHHALNDSVRQLDKTFEEELQFDWISTDILNYKTAFKNIYCGLWIAPGSPYKDMENVINTITFARENNIPTLGNCGGFQHMLIEFAKNVCGIVEASHEEITPNSSELVISKLLCSLVEKEEQLNIVDKNSILYNILKTENFKGRYYCSYGLNSRYVDTLKSNGIKITSLSSDNDVRSFELENHPFFVGTLFQPALISTYEKPNPIIRQFVRKSIDSTSG